MPGRVAWGIILRQRLAQTLLWIVALFYLYGASVHILNMLSLTGFSWPDAPLKWQILDVVYLVLDLLVVVGIFTNRPIGFVAFYIAAISQIILYTVFQAWIVDVPEAFAVTDDQRAYLTTLTYFHLVTILLVTAALLARTRGSTTTVTG